MLKSFIDVSEKLVIKDIDGYNVSAKDIARKAMLKHLIETTGKSRLEILREMRDISSDLFGISLVSNELIDIEREIRRRELEHD